MDSIRAFGRNTFSSLSIRNYRFYFIGQAISLCGTWMQTVALGWLVLELTGSGTQLGAVVALQFLPLLIAGPWGGLIADRVNKRTILYWTQALFGVVTLAVSILVWSGHATLWEIYVFAAILGIIRIFDNPTRQIFVTELVGSEHTKNAVSLNATANNLARAVGPSIGGILIAGVGIAACFFLNALSYVAALIALYMMKEEELGKAPKKARTPGELTEGFVYVLHEPAIRDTLLMMALVGTFIYEFQVSLPILAQGTFHGDASSYALLLAAMGIGSVMGGLYSAGRHAISPRQLLVFLAFLGASLIGVSLMPTLEFAAAGMFIVGFFSINVTSLGNTMLQLESEPAMRGRVMALWGMAMLGSTPIGGPIIGYVGEHWGGRWGLAVGGISAFVAIAYALFALRRKDKTHEISPAVQEEADSAAVHNLKMS